MDVNGKDWSQKKFIEEAQFCENFENSFCKKTGFICKDYLCPFVKNSKNFEEFKKKING